jgi:glutamine synthetase
MHMPMEREPGSAMHIHQSVIDKKTGKNIFSADDGSETEAFFAFIGGMQKHVPNALVMFAPYVNSYRRLTQAASAPVNNKWGYDNRTTAFRVPRSDPAARRVENRIPSSDANPYLALAASLACGLIGMTKKLEPEPPVLTTANEDEIDLPRGLLEAVDLFEGDEELAAVLGQSFATTYAAIKRAEFETFMEVISPWEREYLLLNV